MSLLSCLSWYVSTSWYIDLLIRFSQLVTNFLLFFSWCSLSVLLFTFSWNILCCTVLKTLAGAIGCSTEMWHNDERNRRNSNGEILLPSRRHISRGIVTFITLLLFATIGTLTWNYEGVQNLVRLSPAERFSNGGNKPTELVPWKAQHRKEYGKSKEEKSIEKETPEEDIKGKDGVIQLDRILNPLVVDLTILKGVAAKGAGKPITSIFLQTKLMCLTVSWGERAESSDLHLLAAPTTNYKR